MELWIRSQDRETLRLAETLDIYNATIEGDEKCYVIEESGTDLGIYSTKERALEVLDEIQKYINNECKFLEREQHTSMGTYKNKEQMCVYEMPEE